MQVNIHDHFYGHFLLLINLLSSNNFLHNFASSCENSNFIVLVLLLLDVLTTSTNFHQVFRFAEVNLLTNSSGSIITIHLELRENKGVCVLGCLFVWASSQNMTGTYFHKYLTALRETEKGGYAKTWSSIFVFH